MTVLKILTYALVSTWSLVSSGYEHIPQLMQPWTGEQAKFYGWSSWQQLRLYSSKKMRISLSLWLLVFDIFDITTYIVSSISLLQSSTSIWPMSSWPGSDVGLFHLWYVCKTTSTGSFGCGCKCFALATLWQASILWIFLLIFFCFVWFGCNFFLFFCHSWWEVFRVFFVFALSGCCPRGF